MYALWFDYTLLVRVLEICHTHLQHVKKNLRLYACNLHVICLYSYLIKELFHLLFAQLTRAAIRHAIGYPRKHLGVTLLAKILDRRQHTHDATLANRSAQFALIHVQL